MQEETEEVGMQLKIGLLGAGRKAQWAKAVAALPGDLRPVLRTPHKVEREKVSL